MTVDEAIAALAEAQRPRTLAEERAGDRPGTPAEREREAMERIITEAEARGRRTVLAELVEFLRNARCDLADPSLRRSWGRQRRRLLDDAIEAQS